MPITIILFVMFVAVFIIQLVINVSNSDRLDDLTDRCIGNEFRISNLNRDLSEARLKIRKLEGYLGLVFKNEEVLPAKYIKNK